MEPQNKELVSIIIPAYNCEQFLRACVDSVLSQTYHNIEVILVNDGSIDTTKDIIEECKKQDSRVIGIHKNNNGVSSARNSGLEVAKGDYIMFIDADDYVSSDYVEYFLSLVKQKDSDFALCTNCVTEKNEKEIKEEIKHLNNEEAVSLLLSFKVYVGCWNKIFKHDFLIKNNIRFNETLFYGEGLNLIINCAYLANNIAISTCAKYFYRKNNLSSATTNFNGAKIENGIKSLNIIKERFLLCEQNLRWWEIHSCFYYMSSFVSIISSHQKKDNKDLYVLYRKNYKLLSKKVLHYKELSFYRKCIVFVGVLFPKLLSFLSVKRKKRIIRKSFK